MIGYALVGSNDLDKAIGLGAQCEDGPGVRRGGGPQAFYTAYFRDLDGNKLCAFRVGPANSPRYL